MFARSVRTPSYRCHKPSGQAVVTLNGHDVYLGPYGTPESRNEYDRIIAEWLASGRRIPGIDDITINELSLRYLDFVDGYYTSNEPANIRHALKPLRRLYGLEMATEFGPLKLKATRLEFIAAGHCRNEINERIRRIVRMFKWAVGEELVPPSLHHGLRAVEGLRKGRGGIRESKPVRPVPDAFVDAIRPFVSRQVWAMIELQRLTGMRPGEACIMRTGDIAGHRARGRPGLRPGRGDLSADRVRGPEDSRGCSHAGGASSSARVAPVWYSRKMGSMLTSGIRVMSWCLAGRPNGPA